MGAFGCKLRLGGCNTQLSFCYSSAGYDLFRQRYAWHKPVRALTIRGINLTPINQPLQLDLFHDAERREKRRAVDNAVDDLRGRFGYHMKRAPAMM